MKKMNRKFLRTGLILIAALLLFGCGGGGGGDSAAPVNNNGPAPGETVINGRA